MATTPNKTAHKTEKTEQYIDNLSYDKDFNISTMELLGHDTDNNVLRRIQVDDSGNLKIDPTSLDARYVEITGDTMTGALTITPTGDTSLTANKDIVLKAGQKLIFDGA